ncbi:MAG: PspC domain-containing protein [Candidatus Izemoplasmatales bacterium]|jgi:phage shock protein C|nr:PspC domain-containing protein [Candidatus Izemoplasmatales bacterium]
MEKRRLYRDTENGKIAGVCAGLADYFDVDVTLIRVLWLIAIFVAGGGLLAYLIMMIVVEPKRVVMERMRKEQQKKDIENDDPFAKFDK